MAKSKDTLGPLQQQVLDYVWDNPQATVRACLEHLNARGNSYAYTTIQTVFDALYRKRLVSRRRRKNAYVYEARQSRTSLLARRLNELLSRFSQSPAPVASSLVDALEAGDAEELQAVVEELKSRGHLK
jgi:predicted transcriptional regulator